MFGSFAFEALNLRRAFDYKVSNSLCLAHDVTDSDQSKLIDLRMQMTSRARLEPEPMRVARRGRNRQVSHSRVSSASAAAGGGELGREVELVACGPRAYSHSRPSRSKPSIGRTACQLCDVTGLSEDFNFLTFPS